MEVSATRWAGALCMLADLARFTRTDFAAAPARAAGAAAADPWLRQARTLAAGMDKFVSKFSQGDMTTLSPILAWLGRLNGGATLGAFEEAINSGFVLSKTRSNAPPGAVTSPPAPGGGPPTIPLLVEAYESFLLTAPRAGGVYAWGCKSDDVL